MPVSHNLPIGAYKPRAGRKLESPVASPDSRDPKPEPARTPAMKAGQTLVEYRDGDDWRAGVVLEATRNRIIVAVLGVPAHRAYLQRHTGNWRYMPETLNTRARRAARTVTLDNWSHHVRTN